MEEEKNTKKLGIGTLSPIISIFAMMFSFTYFGKYSIGGEILHALGLSFPTLIVSLVLLAISILIGYKNKEDRYAESGITLSVGFILLIVITSISSLFFNR